MGRSEQFFSFFFFFLSYFIYCCYLPIMTISQPNEDFEIRGTGVVIEYSLVIPGLSGFKPKLDGEVVSGESTIDLGLANIVRASDLIIPMDTTRFLIIQPTPIMAEMIIIPRLILTQISWIVKGEIKRQIRVGLSSGETIHRGFNFRRTTFIFPKLKKKKKIIIK